MRSRIVSTAATLFVVLGFTMAACGGRGENTETPSDATPIQTNAGTVKESPTPTRPVALPNISGVDEGPAGVALVTDVLTVNPGETFTKLWRIRNTGTREWSDAPGKYLWVFVGGDRMNGPNQVPIMGPVPPDGEYDVNVQLTAPAAPGLYEGRWRLHDPGGQPISSEFSVRIEVPAAGAELAASEPVAETRVTDLDSSAFIVPIEEATPPQAGTEAPDVEPVAEAPPAELEEGCLDAAPVADVTIPDGAVLNPEEEFTKIWRLRNSGTCEWSNALGEFQWVFVGGDQMSGPSQVPIVGPVPPGGQYDIEVELTAPAAPGLYEGRWQLHGSNGDPVGVLFWVLIEVPEKSPAPAVADSPPSNGVDLGQEIWRHINGERDRQKLYQLAYNGKLALAAQSHAEDCSQRGSCSHTGSDGSDEADRVRRVGYEGTVDESWAWAASPLDAVNWWLDEVPPNDWHRRMLLSDYLAEVGVGVARAESGYYFIAVFGITGH